MKKQFFLIVATMLASTSLLAQTNNNVDEVVKIEQHAARAYREGELIVKFKPTSAVQMRSLKHSITSNTNTVDKVFGELGITASEALMPLTGAEVVPGARALRSISGKPIHNSDMSNLYRLTFDGSKMNVFDAVEKMAALDEVEYAEPNYLVYSLSSNNMLATDKPNDPLGDEQWGNGQLKLDFLWKQKPITDKRPIIAILDTGVDIEHPDLKDNIWTNEAEQSGAEDEDDDANGFADDLHGWDFVNQTGRLGDWNGHGTHCAGIAAAVGDNKIGITGANPYALIMPITVMQSDGTGDVATIIKGIDYAAANGANVISMSIGGYGYSLAEEQALAKAYNKAVLVAAAGNDNKCIYAHDCPVNGKGAMQNGPMYPAAFTFVLGVEASTKDGGLASFSNFDEDGPVFSAYNEEQLYNYELRAPGAQIMSTFPGGKYKKLNGTSMACPYVAGGISRLLQVKEYGNWEILFGDLIHARKHRCEHEHDENVDFEAVYKITDEDRKPALSLVTYTLDDAEGGDGDTKPDAGETIAFYPTLRNEWGQAENIRFSLELAEAEDPTIVEFLDDNADFGKQLSSYGKNISANPIRFKVREDCADGRKICMVFRATCDNITEELVQEFTLTAENGVEIGGMITEDLTLYPNVHYIVTKTILIPSNVRLTILPGTILKFKDNTGITSEGSFECNGEPGKLIVFQPADLLNRVHVTFRNIRCEYTKIENLWPEDNYLFLSCSFENCILSQNKASAGRNLFQRLTGLFVKTNLFSNTSGNEIVYFSDNIESVNIVNNKSLPGGHSFGFSIAKTGIFTTQKNNIFNNYYGDVIANIQIEANGINYYEDFGIYLGSISERIVQMGVYDFNNPYKPTSNSIVNLSSIAKEPYSEAHGIVWKVVVNGFDAQDEFELLPPLGVGKHKFEVYFNRPMDTSVEPMIAMGVRPPYTSHSIAEDGSWSADSLIYTAYLSIDGKTGADGLNRIYVSGACDNEYFDIPIENTRFNVEVAAAGSMATGLMAEAGLGKVTLTWETDEEDFADLLGYNIYRYTMNEGISSDSIIVNPSILDSEETEFVDYDVVPGTTYYYVIKQLTTSLTSHALSNAIAATPLTAQKGDANGSMTVDIADLVTEVAYITYQNPQPFIFEAADVNSDQKVNVLDVVGTISIIANPTGTGISSVDNEPVRYYVKDGILYVETAQALGGVQVRLHAEKGTEITAQDGLRGMEQTSVWTSDSEFLFLAYSMSGRTLAPGTHALLKIGNEALITEMVISDSKGRNVPAMSDDATGIGVAKQAQLQVPSPNPFTTQLNVPYLIGMSGEHNVTLTFSDLAGRVIDTYNTVSTQGENSYTWKPGALQRGMYFVTLHVDGKFVQTAKVVCNN